MQIVPHQLYFKAFSKLEICLQIIVYLTLYEQDIGVESW